MSNKKAEADYQRGMKYKDIAEKYGVSLNTVKSWKQRYGWEREKGAHKEKGMHTKKPGAPPGNKNAVGNRGGPGGPPQNDKAVTHGFFQKYLPADSLEIMEQIQRRNPIDMLWDNIMIQYTAIIRAQQIMHVTDKGEMIKELKKRKFDVVDTSTEEETKYSQVVTEEEYEFQFAWDRQATFLQAQSRAMAELRSLVKQFNEMAHEDDERRLRLEQMELSVEKSKLELEKLQADNEPDDDEDDGFIEALSGQAEEVWSDGDDSSED